MLIDTHCHLHFPDFDADREDVIRRAGVAGVRYLVNVGTDPATNEAASELAQKHDFMVSTAGLHPHHAGEAPRTYRDDMRCFVETHATAAIGEIGLDYFKSESSPERQKEVFAGLLSLAVEKNLPVIVHSRNAFRDTIDLLKTEARNGLRAVMHCYTYDDSCLKEVLDLGLFASFTAIMTYKNAKGLLETAAKVPLDRLLLETDSPYLAPQIVRGKRNEPAYLAHAAALLAEKRGIDRAELEEATTRNAMAFFNLGTSA